MDKLINDFFRGIIVWAFIAGIHGLTMLMGHEAAKANKRGLINSKSYTEMLIKDGKK